jgi:hypothetical protein
LTITALGPDEIGLLKHRLTKKQVYEGSIICLDNEEEDLFRRYGKERRPNDYVWRIGPYLAPDQIRVPWRRRKKSNRNQKEHLVYIETSTERPIDQSERNSRWDRVRQMSMDCVRTF